MKKYLLGTCVLNEGEKIKRVITKLKDFGQFDILLIDDGSSDGAVGQLRHPSLSVIRNEVNRGAGFALRQMFDYALQNGYEAIFFISGNDKDDPRDLEKLIKAIEEGADFVQGSRYLKGGGFGRMPFYRRVATQFFHPWLFSLMTGRWITDSTNGFRAIRLKILKDHQVDVHQTWLDRYELEPYLFYKAIKLGYRVKEVPVTKIYPPRQEGYSKMKPITGWWSILRPLFYLGLGVKK